MLYSLKTLFDDVAQVQHRSHNLFGSGRLIGPNLVLTARHVVIPEGAAAPVEDGWQVRLIAGRQDVENWTWIDASVTWAGHGTLDLALLKLHPREGAPDWYPKLKLRIGRIDAVQHHSIRCLGFPRGAKVDNKRTLFVPSGDLDDEDEETLSLGVDQAYQPESPGEDWRGFSGGVVLLAESPDPEVVWIYGVAQHVPSNFTRRIAVARLAKAWEDSNFRDAVNCSEPPADPTVSVTVSHAGLVLYDGDKVQALSRERLSMARTWLCALPETIGAFVGREEDLTHLRTIILATIDSPTGPSVLCISGKPGVGKSTLMLRLAHSIKGRFSDGVLYINLHGLDSNFVDSTAALRLFLSAITEVSEKDLQDRTTLSRAYDAALKVRSMLVVLDDARDAEQVRPLIPRSSRCATIVTSRRTLATVANPVGALIRLEALTPVGATSLIRGLIADDRADRDPSAIDELVQLCGCLPLALSIVAARLRSRPDWPVSYLVSLLRDEQTRLAHLQIDDLAVRSCVALSYLDLDPYTRRLFRVASVVPGRDFISAGIAAMLNEPKGRVLMCLNQLVDRNLIEARIVPDPETSGHIDQFSFHSLILLYAKEEFSVHDEAERFELETRLADYYCARATGFYTLPDWFEFERVNLLAVARLEHERTRWESLREIRVGMRKHLGGSVHYSDMEEVLKYERSALRVLHLTNKEAELLEEYAAVVEKQPGRVNEAASLWAEAEELWGLVGNKKAAARCCFEQSCLFGRQGAWPDAIRVSQRSMECFDALEEFEASGVVLANLLSFALKANDWSALDRNATRGEQLLIRLRTIETKSRLSFYLGRTHSRRGRITEAIQLFKRAAEYDADLNHWKNEAVSYSECAQVLIDQKAWQEAITYLERSIAAWRKAKQDTRLADEYTSVGLCCAMLGQWERAYEAHSECFDALQRSQEAELARRAASAINKAIAGLAAGHLDLLKELKEAIELTKSCERPDLLALAVERGHRLSGVRGAKCRSRAQNYSTYPVIERHPGPGFTFVENLPHNKPSVGSGLLASGPESKRGLTT
jgi:tetratricopeptide (TPR) repeat protein